MPARELPIPGTPEQLSAAAAGRERVRLRGTVAERGYGWSGRYKQAWLRIDTPAGSVRVTATTTSPLGTLRTGDPVELAARLTGIVDLSAGVYYAERAQLFR